MIVGQRVRRSVRAFVRLAADHAWVVTAGLCVIVLALGVHGFDLPAQEYRVWLFRTHGIVLWDSNWFGGQSDIGYSALFSPVASVLGASITGALACVASTMIFDRLVPARVGPRYRLTRLWFAVAVVADLVVGRSAFACGLALGLGAVLAVRRQQSWLALACAAGCSLFSPLAGFFLLLAAAAWAPSLGWRRTTPLAGAAAGLVVAAAFGGGGLFPITWPLLLGQVVIVALALLFTPRAEPVIRRAAVIYGAVCVALFVVPNPVGANVARMAGIVVGPLAAYVLLGANRRRVLLALAGPLIIWQLAPVTGSMASAAGDPSSTPSYFAGMLRYLDSHGAQLARTEIPLTRNHWETVYVAEDVPLARGWDRQLDRARNAVLYQPLTPAGYHAWLEDNAVRFVALPNVPLDPGGVNETVVLHEPLPWLRVVYRDPNWTVWELTDPTPIASGVAHLTQMAPGSFTLRASEPGMTQVRVRWSAFWHVDSGAACLSASPDGWTNVGVQAAGVVRISTAISFDLDFGGAPSVCTGGG